MLPFVRMINYGNKAPTPAPIKDIKCSMYFTVVLMASGELFVRGRDQSGAFGMGNASGTKVTVWTPTLDSVQKVWVTAETILVQKFNGEFWFSGNNSYIGVPGGSVNQWTDCSSLFALLEADIKDIVTSKFSLSVLLSNDTIWSTGYGSYGELGNNTTANITGSFVKATIPDGIIPHKIFANSTMHGFNTEDGKLYYTGTIVGYNNNDVSARVTIYTLNSTSVGSPNIAYSNNEFVAIGINQNSSLVKNVYNGGAARFGALGNGQDSASTYKAYSTISAGQQPAGERLSVNLGYEYYKSFVVTTDGVYGSGYNTSNYVCLGVGSSGNKLFYTKCILPSEVTDMPNVKVIGTNFRTYLTDGNYIYSTGTYITDGGTSSTEFILDDPRFPQ